MFQLLHEFDERCILSKVIQIVVGGEKRIAGETIVRRGCEPFCSLFRLMAESEGGGNVISGVVKVAEALALFNSQLDLRMHFSFIARRGRQHCLNAVEEAAAVLRIVGQQFRNFCRRFIFFPEIKEGPGRLIANERRLHLFRNSMEDGQGFLILSAKCQRPRDSIHR